MDNGYLAKSGKETLITIQQHTTDLLKHYYCLKKTYPNILDETDWELLKISAIYHDLGKANRFFQNKMYKYSKLNYEGLTLPNGIKEIPHNFLSPSFIPYNKLKEKFGKENANIILQAVYYHHEREAPEDEKRIEYIEKYLKEDIKKFQFDFLEELQLNAKYKSNMSDKLRWDKKYAEWQKHYIKVKGLLHRLDYAASGGLDNIEKRILDDFDQTAADKVILRYGKELKSVQKYMMENKNRNLIVEASTGIGKTEAALLWLDNQKGFYTLPLQVSINAIYERVHNDLSYKPAALLHSNALQFYLEEKDDINQAIKQYNEARQLSEALTICTVAQIFRFVYLYNGFECILATLSYSKVIIDEIQMYSPAVVGMLLAGIKRLTDIGGKYAIITATFPKCLYSLMEKYHIPVPEGSGKYFYNEKLPVRHRIKIMGKDFDFDKIKKLSRTKKVLVLCNTVNAAVSIYRNLRVKEANVEGLLHSRFIKKDRNLIEGKILDFAPNQSDRNNKSGIWISTQIVEASLDIDFDVLISEMCTIDSLLQRMGRVYRNRDYDGSEPNVYIVDNKNGVGLGENSVIDPMIYELSINALKSKDGELLYERNDNDDKLELMDMVYNSDGIKESNYYKSVDSKLRNALNYRFYDLDKTDLREIDSVTVIPNSIYNQLQSDGIISGWKSKLELVKHGERQKILSEIMLYTLSLRSKYSLDDINLKQQIIFENSHIYSCDDEMYDFKYDSVANKITGVGLVRKKQQYQKEKQEIKAELL